MKSSSSSSTSSSNTRETEMELRPGGMLVQQRDDPHQSHSQPLIKINVSHGPHQHDVSVPPHSTFGYLKRVLEQKTGLESMQQKILFRGQEKEDGEYLHEAGLKDKSKVLLLEEPASGDRRVEDGMGNQGTSKHEVEEVSEGVSKVEVKESEEMLRALQSIDGIRAEVDKLAERVSALEVAVSSGTKIAEEEFVVSSELLMRQLLKLDAIEAEGEAKIQRKAEVLRVQNFHETLDSLKAKNSNPFNNAANTVSVTTGWETFDSGVGSLNPPPPMSSSTRITEDWERFD